MKHYTFITKIQLGLLYFCILVAFLIGYVCGGLYVKKFGTEVKKRENRADVKPKPVDSMTLYIPLQDSNVLSEIKRQGIHHPEIVLAQAKLETGNFTSNVCIAYNNLFGLRKPDGSYHRFQYWQQSVKAYKDWVQDKYVPPNDYFDFLDSIGYAEDKSYTDKLREMI